VGGGAASGDGAKGAALAGEAAEVEDCAGAVGISGSFMGLQWERTGQTWRD
jgi:hypothetical protein